MRNGTTRRFLQTAALCAAFSAVSALLVWRVYANPNVPHGIAYSGELMNNGVPDNAMHNFTFLLFDAAGGTALCTDGPRSITVTAGRFDVADLFGANCSLDTMLATKTGLQIQVTVDNTILTPMQPLGTVPFAARSRVAETAENLSGTLVGDVTGTQQATSVVGLRGIPLGNVMPTDGQALRYNKAKNYWAPVGASGGLGGIFYIESTTWNNAPAPPACPAGWTDLVGAHQYDGGDDYLNWRRICQRTDAPFQVFYLEETTWSNAPQPQACPNGWIDPVGVLTVSVAGNLTNWRRICLLPL